MPLADMVDLLRRWVEIETPSDQPDRVAAFAAIVAQAFVEAGCRAIPHRDALQLDWGGGGSKPVLVLGHLDTVYPLGTSAHMPFRVEGERAFGPGVFDMKGGLVQALFALRRLPPPKHRAVTFLWVCDEEVGSPRSRPLTEKLARAASAVLVLEPAADGGRLKTSRKGIARYTLAAQGIAAHAGVDFEKGASAILPLARLVLEASSWSDPEAGITVNCGCISGGTAGNVVPASASAELETRAWRAADLDRLDQRLRALAASHRVELRGGINRPPMEATPAALAIFERARSLGRGLGLDLEATRTGGGSDGNFTAALGVPTLDGLGMVGAGAHAVHEQIELGQFLPRTALLAALLTDLASLPERP